MNALQIHLAVSIHRPFGFDPQGMVCRQQVQHGKRPIARLVQTKPPGFKNSLVFFVFEKPCVSHPFVDIFLKAVFEVECVSPP